MGFLTPQVLTLSSNHAAITDSALCLPAHKEKRLSTLYACPPSNEPKTPYQKYLRKAEQSVDKRKAA
jgi:hypothetical protein